MKKVPRLRSDEEAEAFLDLDLSDLDFAQFKPLFATISEEKPKRSGPSRAGASYRFEVYKDRSGEFRYRFRAPNGEALMSARGYSTRSSTLKAMESFWSGLTVDVGHQRQK